MIKKLCGILTLFFAFSLALNALPLKGKKQVEPEVKKIDVKGLELLDWPSDRGDSFILKWDIDENKDISYEIYLSTDESNWVKYKDQKNGESTPENIDLPFWMWKKNENKNAVAIPVLKVFKMNENEFFKKYKDGFKMYAKLKIISKDKIYESNPVWAVAKGNWFRTDRINNLLIVIIITLVFFLTLSHAKKRELFIRRIAGLDAIDEAVGRATEMGKPVIYVPGIGSMANISTIASVFILGEVSKKIALYDATIKVPHYDPIVFTVSKETVKQAYIEAERPDSYREDINMFITQDQFAYAAAVDGMITREKPAACFYMGYFMAESLLLAEVGSSVGAIQIAGTDIDSQLPFFVTACDYTLIGEELYAAGAYLSKEPMLVSALKVQDFGKMFFIVISVLFSIILAVAAKNQVITSTILDLLKVR